MESVNPAEPADSVSAPLPGPGQAAFPVVETSILSGVLTLTIVRQTDVGRVRSHNEDAADSLVPGDPRKRARKGILCLVADGMGGHRAGEIASQHAVDLTLQSYYADSARGLGASLARAFQAANREIHAEAHADPSLAGMGTTLVAAVIRGGEVYVGNVGDSRAYMVDAKGMARITDDHSWVEEQVRAGLLAPDQARGHPRHNLVTRALGTKLSVNVDLFERCMGPGDLLLLCSDGLTNMLEDQEIEAILRQHPVQEAVPLLVEAAKERGGNDNITVLVIAAARDGSVTPKPVKGRAAWLRWLARLQRD